MEGDETRGVATGATDAVHDKCPMHDPNFERQHGFEEFADAVLFSLCFSLLRVALQIHLALLSV